MLLNLKIKNLAVIRQLDINFKSGMSVITGETGAGKSIVIEALGLILGDRANTVMIREGSPSASVTALFNIDGRQKNAALNILNELAIEAGHEIEIRREISSSGRSRALINDSLVNVSDLKRLGSLLVEMHGQHEHQKLLDSDTHIHYLDAFLHDDRPVRDHKTHYANFRRVLDDLNKVENDKIAYEKEFELKQYHFKELQNMELQENELESLQEESRMLEHAEMLTEMSAAIAERIYENDSSILDELKDMQRSLQQIVKVDPQQQELYDELQSSIISLRELGMSMAAYRDNVVFDPKRLDAVRTRLNDIYKLEKKHKKAYPELFAYFLQLKEEVKEQQDYDYLLEEKRKNLESQREKLRIGAEVLSEARKNASRKFAASINTILKKMGMKHADFKPHFKVLSGERGVYITSKGRALQVSENGMDQVIFRIITNPGDNYKPLDMVVSGGELSRIMLAVKSTLSEKDDTPTLIFDEADAGISGQVARTVGEQIQSLASHHQVLCITHLPQIASLGEQHFKVSKELIRHKNETTMHELDRDQRITEIAGLISAGRISEHSMKTALELLNQE